MKLTQFTRREHDSAFVPNRIETETFECLSAGFPAVEQFADGRQAVDIRGIPALLIVFRSICVGKRSIAYIPSRRTAAVAEPEFKSAAAQEQSAAYRLRENRLPAAVRPDNRQMFVITQLEIHRCVKTSCYVADHARLQSYDSPHLYTID